MDEIPPRHHQENETLTPSPDAGGIHRSCDAGSPAGVYHVALWYNYSL
jgi:hypothetical protein